MLDGTVDDDGLPAPVTTTWTKTSGPGTVNFGDPSAVDTTVTFSSNSTYVLRLTANDVALGDYSDEVTVTVNPAPVPPTITSQPTSQTVTEPESAAFSVVATGAAPLTYQWRRNAVNMLGETNAGLTLATTTVADSGVFDVMVSNVAGSVTSAPATLTVTPAPQPPSITTQPANQTVTAPAGATFSVVATGDTPLTYQWRRNEAEMLGEVSASVTLLSTTVGDSGDMFDVVVSNVVGSATSASATLTVEVLPPPPPAPPTVFERRVSTGNDDAEESSSGSVNLSSSDLELVQESSTQTIGIRFQNVGIPPEATVVNAWLQFQADESHSGVTSLTIAAQASANPATFSSSSGSISSRPRLTETVSWSPPAWSTGNQGPAQQTPNLAPVIQAVVTQQNWTSGNSLVIIITGSGKRVAESYNGSSSAATLLHVEYATGPPPNTPPVVNAGTDDTVAWGYGATLDATVTDDGLPAPPGVVTTLWEQTGGPLNGASFVEATAIDTTVSFLTDGIYTLRLTADDGEWQPLPFDEVTITVAVNQAPTVSVAAVPPVTLPSGAALDGTVTDDGLPGPVTTTWTKTSGLGIVTFGNMNAIDTTASFSLADTYVLRLTADDVDLGDSFAEVTVTVNPAPANQPPTVLVAAVPPVTLPAAAVLDGTVTDDGLPAPPGVVTTLWEQTNGPTGGATFTDANAVDTTVTFSIIGTYTLRLTADDGEWQPLPFDEVTVEVLPPPPGPQTIFFDDLQQNEPFTLWVESNEFDWTVKAPEEKQVPGSASGNRVGHADNCDNGCFLTLAQTINLSPYESATLSFWRYVDASLDSGEYLRVEISNGSAWTTIFEWTHGSGDDDQWHLESYDIPVTHLVAGFSLRFVSRSTSTGEDNEIDDVLLEGMLLIGGNYRPVADAGSDQTVTDQDGDGLETVTLDGSASSDPEGQIVDWEWAEGGSVLGNGETLDADLLVGNYTVTLTVTDDGGATATDEVLVRVLPQGGGDPTILEVRVSTGNDDAEEQASGSVGRSSSDLELVQESSTQTVGIRFQGVDIPPGAVIVNAWLQFQADESHSGGTSLTIAAEASANPVTFSSTNGNISSRPRLTETVSWSPPAWSTGNQGPAQQTPDLALVIQAVVNQQNWTSGNSLAIIITGSGKRVAESYNGSASAAALLHVEYY